MALMLGNLSVDQMEKRLGIEFPEQIKEFMLKNRQENATDIAPGKWHCFDVPFHIVCGDMETAKKIYGSVKERKNEVKATLNFSINTKNS